MINIPFLKISKYDAETNFWIKEIENYVNWYLGNTPEHYGTCSPRNNEKFKSYSIESSAILTWKKLHQEKKYLKDLLLKKGDFKGLRILDIGSGPIPSAEVFADASIYCLDPLFDKYLQAGFPLHIYKNVRFVFGKSENIPIASSFFDVIISVNAIDHVDDFEKTVSEIKRVLKPGGKIIIHAHYHKPTTTEPLELSDDVFTRSFSWCKGFKKKSEAIKKYGSQAKSGEKYALWSNF